MDMQLPTMAQVFDVLPDVIEAGAENYLKLVAGSGHMYAVARKECAEVLFGLVGLLGKGAMTVTVQHPTKNVPWDVTIDPAINRIATKAHKEGT